mmetsp:Transcript_27171/g.65384  ORF Transcript_27171/g.65384 Transcript_27171/m.65384 type:complete len:254 (-) Transcript_27171:304-1065(-)
MGREDRVHHELGKVGDDAWDGDEPRITNRCGEECQDSHCYRQGLLRGHDHHRLPDIQRPPRRTCHGVVENQEDGVEQQPKKHAHKQRHTGLGGDVVPAARNLQVRDNHQGGVGGQADRYLVLREGVRDHLEPPQELPDSTRDDNRHRQLSQHGQRVNLDVIRRQHRLQHQGDREDPQHVAPHGDQQGDSEVPPGRGGQRDAGVEGGRHASEEDEADVEIVGEDVAVVDAGPLGLAPADSVGQGKHAVAQPRGN